MVLRRALLPALALLLLGAGIASAGTSREHHALRRQLRFLQAHALADRVALRDVDNDGDLDILVAPRDGALVLWRNSGHGRFRLATMPPAPHTAPARGPRLERLRRSDDGWQWGDERYDAALPRAPAATAIRSVVLVRTVSPHSIRPVPEGRSAGRAPPLA
jgi:hypothetical protein